MQAALPFSSKPKQQAPKGERRGYATQRAVVMEPAQRKAYTMLQQVFTLRNAKVAKAKETRAASAAAYAIKKAAESARIAEATKKARKRALAAEGLKSGGGGKKARSE